MKLGIIGCGRIGNVHGLAVEKIDNASVCAVNDPFEKNAISLAEKIGAKVGSTEEIISNSDIDAIVIATPTTTHYDLIHQAANAGKAIFCEKPVDLDSDRIRDCITVVEENNVPFMAAFNRRFDKNFANIQQRISDGAIGNVEILTILSRDPAPPPIEYIKTSGGIFRDMMIHDFDMARFLLNEEPISIHATGAALIDEEIGAAGDIDTAAVTLTTASGKICQISNSRRASYGYDQRIEVHGSKGMLRAENIRENTVEIATETGFSTARAELFFLERYAEAYTSELRHFVDSVKGGTKPSPSIEDGLKAQLIADAAAVSFNEKRVVEL